MFDLFGISCYYSRSLTRLWSYIGWFHGLIGMGYCSARRQGGKFTHGFRIKSLLYA